MGEADGPSLFSLPSPLPLARRMAGERSRSARLFSPPFPSLPRQMGIAERRNSLGYVPLPPSPLSPPPSFSLTECVD